jgi:hypothetical protein
LLLQHLHLHGILLTIDLRSKAWAEGHAVWIHTGGLVLGEAIGGTVDGSGHGDAAIGKHGLVVVGGQVDKLILLFL